MNTDLTVVTGLWDLRRDQLTEGWSRPFTHYLTHLDSFLKIPANLFLYLPPELHDYVWERRDRENTYVHPWTLDDVKSNFPFYDRVQEIRKDPEWYNFTGEGGWLTNSTQAQLQDYNPVVMSKMFRLHDAMCFKVFNSSHFIWLDAAITHTVHEGYFTHDKVLDKLPSYMDKFTFVSFPYDGKYEIHGFEYKAMCEYSRQDVNLVSRAGIFGGPRETLSEMNQLYYSLLQDSLQRGYMGTEESIHTILTYRYPELVQYYEIEENGLLGTFFENLKNDTLIAKTTAPNIAPAITRRDKTGMYVLTFNSPVQFEGLCKSMDEYDPLLLASCKKYLINNSTDESTDVAYDILCEIYGFEEIRKPENLGICGGRQFIAEHFNDTDLDEYFFFEDDMFFASPTAAPCKCGFNRYIKNIFRTSRQFRTLLDLDVLKLSFSEFYGDNSRQWAWYNVPQSVRDTYWPDYNKLPETGLDGNVPKVDFKNIHIFGGVPCITGEVYYSNWPQLITREGNKKLFLDVTWAHPHEQTWMSQAFQLAKHGLLNIGVFLASPISHERSEHYEGTLRKES